MATPWDRTDLQFGLGVIKCYVRFLRDDVNATTFARTISSRDNVGGRVRDSFILGLSTNATAVSTPTPAISVLWSNVFCLLRNTGSRGFTLARLGVVTRCCGCFRVLFVWRLLGVSVSVWGDGWDDTDDGLSSTPPYRVGVVGVVGVDRRSSLSLFVSSILSSYNELLPNNLSQFGRRFRLLSSTCHAYSRSNYGCRSTHRYVSHAQHFTSSVSLHRGSTIWGGSFGWNGTSGEQEVLVTISTLLQFSNRE